MPISALALLIQQHEHSHEGRAIVLTGVDGAEKASIESTLQNAGYRIDPIRTFKPGKVLIELGAQRWEGNCPIYMSWKDLYVRAMDYSRLPEDPIVFECINDFQAIRSSDPYKRIGLALKLREVLVQLADLCDPIEGHAKGSSKLHFLIQLDDTSVKLDVSPKLDWEQLSSLENLDAAIVAVDKLSRAINVGDHQDEERKNVMRSALCEVVDSRSDQQVFLYLMTSLVKLHRRYDELHQVFVQKFSVNKVLKEVNEQNLDFQSKISDVISNSQLKALTMPAALVVIGAVMKIDHIVDALAVALGMLISVLIVNRGLSVHEATFTRLKSQIEDNFGNYDCLGEKAEIRQKARECRDELIDTVLDNAKDDLVFMRRSIWLTFILTLGFIIYTATDISASVSMHEDKVEVVQPKEIKVVSDIIAVQDKASVLPSRERAVVEVKAKLDSKSEHQDVVDQPAPVEDLVPSPDKENAELPVKPKPEPKVESIVAK
ncbi:TPA: hypothetical protein I7120_19065 [Vibrio vulnificus]|nr:hypothetical protein [Vibrio vulnificus]